MLENNAKCWLGNHVGSLDTRDKSRSCVKATLVIFGPKLEQKGVVYTQVVILLIKANL